MIGPLTSAALRVVPAAQHGIASSLVVVARMTGMLIGVAALSAWGLYRFNQILASLPPGGGDTLAAKVAAEAQRYRTAFAMQYGSIFFITTIVCWPGRPSRCSSAAAGPGGRRSNRFTAGIW